jgi:hypothetical protein
MLVDGSWESLDGLIIGGKRDSRSLTEASAFVGYLLDEYGRKKFAEIWNLTTPLGGDVSLDTAMKEVIGRTLKQAEEDLKDFITSS